MIQHIVMLSLNDDADPAALHDVMVGLDALRGTIAGFHSFEHGINRDFEGKSQDYHYGFVCGFANTKALTAYAENADHKAMGGRLVAMCQGGANGIMVMDIETS